MKLTAVSWNLNGLTDPWEHLPDGVDVGLFQETKKAKAQIEILNGPGPAAVDWTNGHLQIEPVVLLEIPHAAAERGQHPTSYPGTIDVALVTDPADGSQLYVVSAYAKWESIGPAWITSDASAHRLISDLSALVTTEKHKIPILVAGDWNMFRGHGETPYWKSRYDTVFDRMSALGFDFVGPSHPDGGIAIHEPPANAMTPPPTATPTYHTTRETPATAWRQLDFVFATRWIADGVTTRAINSSDLWGPSDHCRVVIEVDF